MNNKYKVSYIILLFSIFTISILSYNLNKVMTKYLDDYNLKNGKLEKITKEISDSKNNIKKYTNELENSEEELEKLNDKKVNLQSEYKKILKKHHKSSVGVGKIIYLTFDDGPSIYTDEILDILDKYDIKATFFVTCQEKTGEFVKKYAQKGHTIGLHTCSHDYGEIYKSKEAYFEDLNTIQNIVKSAINKKTHYIRFPGGASNTVSKFTPGIMTLLTEAVEKEGYRYYDWNIDSNDAAGYTSDMEYNHVIEDLSVSGRTTNMILMHDIKLSTKESLERIIIDAKNMGYEFENITDDTPQIHHLVNN